MTKRLILMLVCASASVFAADQQASPSIGKIFDGELKSAERDIVPLVEAMPADKFNFAPTTGEFKGVRTFGEQAKHIGGVLYVVGAALLGEKPPAESGGGENGPASAKSKDEIVKYLKDAFAYAHKAMATVTDANATGLIDSPFGDGKMPRAAAAGITTWHSFDHYGQMVVYARMNGVVPPASRQ